MVLFARERLWGIEDRGQRTGVAALHVLRDVGLGLELGVVPRQAEDRRLDLRLLLRELRFLRALLVKLRLELLEALAGFLGGRTKLLQLPLRILELDLVRFAGV